MHRRHGSSVAAQRMAAALLLLCCTAVSILDMVVSEDPTLVAGGLQIGGTYNNQLHSALVAQQWEFSLPESVLQQTFLFQVSLQSRVPCMPGHGSRGGWMGGLAAAA